MASGPGLPSVSEEEGARPDERPLPTPASSALQAPARTYPNQSRALGQEMTFLPTPTATTYSTSDELTDFPLGSPLKAPADFDGVEELMSKYLNDLVADACSDQVGWSWDVCGMKTDETAVGAMSGSAGVNVF